MADIILKDIKSETAIHDFPDIYNKNNTELINIIQELQTEIENLKSSHKKDVDNLISKFNTWKTTQKDEFNSMMPEFEKTFVTKDKYEEDVNTYSKKMIDQQVEKFDDTFVTKENYASIIDNYLSTSQFKSVVRSIVESIINENK